MKKGCNEISVGTVIYGMYAECANMLDIQEKVKIFNLIQEMDKIKPNDTNIHNLIHNLFSKSSNKYGQDIAKRIQTQINMLNTNADYKTAAIEYCNKYLDYVKHIEHIHELERKSNISLRYIISKLGNPLDNTHFDNETIYNDFLLNYYNNTYYYKFWNNRIKEEHDLISNMQNKTVQDMIELNTRIASILHSLKLMELKYEQIHDKDNTITADTFIAIMPSIYTQYIADDDVANLNDLL